MPGSPQSAEPAPMPLIDTFGRRHDSLRLSITDRCNIRCTYCMPEHEAQFAPKDQLLRFEEILRLCELLVRECGVGDIRVTGGEPLVRRDCVDLIKMLAGIPDLRDLSMTTNGMLLSPLAQPLRRAGLRRLNISIDTLDEETFFRISRRRGLSQVIAGIDAAIDAGFDSIRLNALAIAGISESELVRLVRFASKRGVTMRFIEFMPLDSMRAWTNDRVLTGDEILKTLTETFGPITPRVRTEPSQPAESFQLTCDDKPTQIGIIRSVTSPFCSTCNRLRLTADGSIRNCLFSQEETPLRDVMRSGASDVELLGLIDASVRAKRAGHGIDSPDFTPPDRAMYSIGG